MIMSLYLILTPDGILLREPDKILNKIKGKRRLPLRKSTMPQMIDFYNMTTKNPYQKSDRGLKIRIFENSKQLIFPSLLSPSLQKLLVMKSPFQKAFFCLNQSLVLSIHE